MSSIDAGIASFLNLPAQYTHQIAIPLETNHDLLLELESVQRAILYHCPLLVDACIVPSATRLPLFWVDASGGGQKNLDSVEKLMVTKALNEMVDEVVDELINVVPVEDRSTGDETNTELLDLEEGKGGRNIDGIQPVMMGFQRLEIDGTKNEILHAVGKEGEGTDLIRRVIDALRVKVEGKGWKTYLPEDEPEGKVGKEERMVGNENWGDKWRWRPRVPFMRLPHNFEDTLPPLDDDDDDDEDRLPNVRMPEEGGNGISPIFWYRWWDDEFAKGVGIRLREIAVYPRTGSGLGGLNAESAFYVPQLKTTLPGGNDMLTASEERDAMYDKARFEAEFNPDEEIRDGAKEYMEIEEQRRREEEETEEDRATLERLYEMEGSSPPPPAAQTEGDSASPSPSKQSSSASGIDDEKIREIIMQRESMKAKDPTAQKKRDNLPSYKENPIFQNLSAMKNKYEADCAKAQKKQTPLPPYPSEEHFVGAWQLVQSPFEGTNGAQENLILRADKTIFGGPILDDEFGHKAAAGSGWSCASSSLDSSAGKDGGVDTVDGKSDEETKLQIRLVIPPTKERTMVLEGIVTRMVSPRPEDYEFTPSTFKIPELEAVKKASEEASKKRREEEEKGNDGSGGGGDGMMSLHVYGDAWMEDDDGSIVSNLGNFALVKLETRNPSEYVYSIPAPTRVQD